MSSVIVLPRSFGTTLTKVFKTSLQTISPFSFETIILEQIDSDAGANWDANRSHYVVPSTGLYQITATIRVDDGQTAGTQFGVGVHTSNADGDWFLWHAVQNTINIERRTTYPYIRTDFFAAGQRIRLFSYSDQGYSCGNVVLNIFRVA